MNHKKYALIAECKEGTFSFPDPFNRRNDWVCFDSKRYQVLTIFDNAEQILSLTRESLQFKIAEIHQDGESIEIIQILRPSATAA